MTNPTLDLIHAHASVRKYRPDPLPRETVAQIVSAGQHTSSSSNLQTYSVIAVTDAGKRARLAELCAGQAQVAEAPLFLAWCADLARLERICQQRGYRQVSQYTENFLIAALDAAIAAQNAALAAESLGLGICYIGAIRNDPPAVVRLLGLPRLVFPVVGLTVGWPDGPHARRPRLPLEAVLHWESYDPGQDEAVAAYDRAMLATGIYQDRQVPAPGNPQASEAYSWSEHSARRVSKPARPFLRAALAEQGFDLD